MSATAPVAERPSPELRLLRQLIWLYFWMLIFEGALRKWVLPQLANQLLILRDPVLLLAYAIALVRGIFPFNGFVISGIVLGLATFAASMLKGSGHLLIYIYGLHADFLHLPLIFLVAKAFPFGQVSKMGEWLLKVSVPMFFLVVVQFASSPEAWVNVGAGGGEGGQMEVGFGKIRPPGTFSFTNGLALFLSLGTAYLLYAALKSRAYSRALLFSSLAAIIGMLIVSGSRGAVGSVVVTLAALTVICVLRPVYAKGATGLVFLGLGLRLLFRTGSVFQQGLEVHQSRFGSSLADLQQGILYRFFADFTSGFDVLPYAATFGAGLGMGTNAASSLLTGERTFLLAEGEWPRVILESGPWLGSAILLLRLAIAFYLGRQALRALVSGDNPLALLLFSACCLPIIEGQFGQPTHLGFACLGGGLCLAAARGDAATEEGAAPTAPAPETLARGRSSYAEQLHGH